MSGTDCAVEAAVAAVIGDVETPIGRGSGAERRAEQRRRKRKLGTDGIQTVEDLLDGWTQCCYFLRHKMRLCNVARIPNARFCGMHLVIAAQEENNKTEGVVCLTAGDKAAMEEQRKRITCPLDSGHSVFVDVLEQHLLVCNARKHREGIQSLPFYLESVNCAPSTESIIESESDATNTMNSEEDLLLEIVSKVEAGFAKIPLTLLNDVCKDSDEVFTTAVTKRIQAVVGRGQTSFRQLRHVEQDAQIVNTLRAYGVVDVTPELHQTIDYEAATEIVHLPPLAVRIKTGVEMVAKNAADEVTKNGGSVEEAEAAAISAGKKFNETLTKTNELNMESEKHRLLLEKRRQQYERIFVELGAGKGLLGLSLHITDPRAYVVFIERDPNRKKVDRLLNKLNSPHQRIRMDIRHCDLAALPCVKEGLKLAEKEESEEKVTRRVTVIAKHLCGVASDFAVRSVARFPQQDNNGVVYRRGVGIATCCHHACQWNDYTGKQWLSECGISASQFELLKHLSGWASVGMTGAKERGEARQRRETDGTQDDDVAEAEHAAPNVHVPGQHIYSQMRMQEIGRRVKRFLDYGRVRFLQQSLGLASTQLVQYCDEELSPESFMIIASE